MEKEARICVIGPGAIGGVLAGVLAREGYKITLVTKHGELGKVEMTSGGEFILGNWKRGKDDQLEKLAVILGHIVETRTSNEIFPELYSKMIINSCITTMIKEIEEGKREISPVHFHEISY